MADDQDLVAVAPGTLRSLSDAQLMGRHAQFFRAWERHEAGADLPEGLNREEFLNRFLFVIREFERRGIKRPAVGSLDAAVKEFTPREASSAMPENHAFDRSACEKLLQALPNELTLAKDFVRFGGPFFQEGEKGGVEIFLRDGFQDSSRDLKLYRIVKSITQCQPFFTLCPDGFPDESLVEGYDLVLRKNSSGQINIINEPDFQRRIYGSDSLQEASLPGSLVDFVAVPAFISVTGSFVYHNPDRKPKDIDVVIKTSDEREEVIDLLEKRIHEATGLEPHFVFEPRGANWSWLPCYDLVFRVRQPIKEQAVRRSMKVPEPEFMIKRLAEGKETLLLSGVSRAGLQDNEWVLINERIKPDQPIRAWGVVRFTQDEGTIPDVAALKDRAVGLDDITRQEFEGRDGPFYVLKFKLVEVLDPPIELRGPLPGRRFGGPIDLDKLALKEQERTKPVDGLVLVEDATDKILEGKKSVVLKSRDLMIWGRPMFLVSGSQAFGVIELGKPREIDLDEFRRTMNKHQVTEEARKADWPDARTLWVYSIDTWEPFPEPRAFDRPQGPQTVIKNVATKFKEEIGTTIAPSGLHEHPHPPNGLHSHLGLPPNTGGHGHEKTPASGGHKHRPDDPEDGFHLGDETDSGVHVHILALRDQVPELLAWYRKVVETHFPVHRWIPKHRRTWLQEPGAEGFRPTILGDWETHCLWSMHSAGANLAAHMAVFVTPESRFLRLRYELEDGTMRDATQADFEAEVRWLNEHLPFPRTIVSQTLAPHLFGKGDKPEPPMQEAFHIRNTHWVPVPGSGTCLVSHPNKLRSPQGEQRCYTDSAAAALRQTRVRASEAVVQRDFDRYFEVTNNQARDLGDNRPENMEPLTSRPGWVIVQEDHQTNQNFAQVIRDHVDGAGVARLAREVIERKQESRLVVVVGQAIGKLESNRTVYRGLFAYGWDGECMYELVEGIRPAFGSTGGKKYLAPTIVRLIPEHSKYVEPFIGGGAVFFAKKPSESEVINDLDGDIAHAYRYIQAIDESKLNGLRQKAVKFSRSLFFKIRDSKPSSSIDRFHRFLYLNAYSFGKDMITTVTEEKGSAFASLAHRLDRFPKIAERLKKVTILNEDFRSVIRRNNSPSTFFYLDPPYPEQQCNLKTDLTNELILAAVKKIRGKFILSLPNTPGVRSVFSAFHKRSVSVRRTLEMKAEHHDSELLIANFPFKTNTRWVEAVLQEQVKPGRFQLPQKPTAGFREPDGRDEAWEEFVKPLLDECAKRAAEA